MTRCGKVVLLLAFGFAVDLACMAQRSDTPAATEEAALNQCCNESAKNPRSELSCGLSE